MFGLKKSQAKLRPVSITKEQMRAIQYKLDVVRILKGKIREVEGALSAKVEKTRYPYMNDHVLLTRGDVRLKVSRDLRGCVDERTGLSEEVFLDITVDQSVLEILKHELKKRLSAAQADARRLGAAEEDL